MKKPNKKSKISNIKNINWENNKNIRLILIFVLILSMGVLFGAIGYNLYKWNEYSKYQSRIIAIHYVNTSVQITSFGIGMNGDTDSLKFGKISLGGGGERGLNINSTKKALVKVTISGDMAQFMSVDKNDFIIEPNTADKITFHIDIPENAETGNYTGLIQVLFLKP